MTTDTRPARAPEVIEPGSGRHLHFLNHLATVKVHPGADGTLSVVEFAAERDFGPPLHRHDHEDELFVVLDGELVFHRGEDRLVGGEGSLAYLPRGIAHTFQVRSATARFVCVTGSETGPPRFTDMVAALGEPVTEPTLPEPGYLDAAHIAEVCQAHGIEVLGPPPVPANQGVQA